MSGRVVLVSAAAAALLALAPTAAQAAQAQGQTITATGTGQARVHPANRRSNASIVAAVDAARKAAIRGALDQAHEYAADYAQAVGLTLGSVVSVSDAQQGGFYLGPGPGAFFGPFGPDQYCGTVNQPIGKRAPGRRPKFKRVHRCIVPPFAYTTLTVTYSAG